MSIALLVSKTFLVPATGTALVAGSVGSAYYIYTNRDKGSTNNSGSATIVSTSTFLARVKTTATQSIASDNTSLKCVIDTNKELDCKVFKFATAKTNNNVTQFEKSTLSEVATATSDLVTNNYVVVELTTEKVTFENLKNKTISLKNGSTELTKLEFDQLLVKTPKAGENKDLYDPIAAVVDTYIVSSAATITDETTTTGISGFRCTYKDTTKTSDLTNYDDSCSLISIPSVTEDIKIPTLQEVKEATTAASALAATTFYKLTLNRNKLYNLDFATAKTNLSVALTASSVNKSTTLTIHQKLTDGAFTGNTTLALAKVAKAKTDTTGTVTGAKCNFSNTTTESDRFPCSLHGVTDPSANPAELKKLSVEVTAKATSDAFAADKYFVIKFTNAQDIATLTKDKTIYYQINKSGDGAQHESVELKIVELLSGDVGTDKKHFFISNYSA